MGANHTESRRVKTSDTVFDIVDTIMRHDGSNIPELAEELGLARSTVHGHLTTLEDRGLLVKEGRNYRLSLLFFRYGNHAVGSLDVIPVAKAGLERLAQQTGETAWLAVEEHGQYVLVDKATGEHGIQTKGKVGRRYPLHAGAVGKVFLAQRDEDEIVDEFGDCPMEQATEQTIIDMDDLLRELDTIRERGIAFSDGEVTEGVRGVAAPIVTDDIVAGILVSGPTNRLRGGFYREEIPNLIRGVTNGIELEIKYD